MLRILASLLACLSVAMSRDVGKVMKTMPVVTNSLINLGKMDIAFYFNGRPQDLPMRSEFSNHGSNPIFTSKFEPIMMEPCPCSSLKYIRDSSQNNPSELLHKILSGNDLFSFKEPTSSTLCCDSHENVQEDILLEFGPKQSQVVANEHNSVSFLPYLLESMQNKPSFDMIPSKAKAVEIFIFPKKQGLVIDKFTTKKKNYFKDDNIKIVGDKEIRNDFKTNRFVPPFVSSVKKDLALQEKTEFVTKSDDTKVSINNNSNTV